MPLQELFDTYSKGYLSIGTETETDCWISDVEGTIPKELEGAPCMTLPAARSLTFRPSTLRLWSRSSDRRAALRCQPMQMFCCSSTHPATAHPLGRPCPQGSNAPAVVCSRLAESLLSLYGYRRALVSVYGGRMCWQTSASRNQERGLLAGTLLRNGPAMFERDGFKKTFLDGDGMITSLAIKDGKAYFRNKFVRTPVFKDEEKEGVFDSLSIFTAEDPRPLKSKLPVWKHRCRCCLCCLCACTPQQRELSGCSIAEQNVTSLESSTLTSAD